VRTHKFSLNTPSHTWKTCVSLRTLNATCEGKYSLNTPSHTWLTCLNPRKHKCSLNTPSHTWLTCLNPRTHKCSLSTPSHTWLTCVNLRSLNATCEGGWYALKNSLKAVNSVLTRFKWQTTQKFIHNQIARRKFNDICLSYTVRVSYWVLHYEWKNVKLHHTNMKRFWKTS